MKPYNHGPWIEDFCKHGTLLDAEYRVLMELYRLQFGHDITRVSFGRLQFLTNKHRPGSLERHLSVLREYGHIQWSLFDDILNFAVDESRVEW